MLYYFFFILSRYQRPRRGFCTQKEAPWTPRAAGATWHPRQGWLPWRQGHSWNPRPYRHVGVCVCVCADASDHMYVRPCVCSSVPGAMGTVGHRGPLGSEGRRGYDGAPGHPGDTGPKGFVGHEGQPMARTNAL